MFNFHPRCELFQNGNKSINQSNELCPAQPLSCNMGALDSWIQVKDGDWGSCALELADCRFYKYIQK